MLALLDGIYGVLVQPRATFARLQQEPQVMAAAILVLAVSGLGMGDLSAASLLGSALGGLLGWLTLNGILWLLAYSLGRDPRWSVLLTLTGFASVPWLLWWPAHAWGNFFGPLLGVAVGIWLVIWQVWATSFALGIPWRRLIWMIPLPFVGIGVSLSWLGATLGHWLSLVG